jgi:2-methylcitrate dehydratase
MIAVPLLYGRLTAADYEEDVARDPRIDALRARMRTEEVAQFTHDYHDPGKRSIANSVLLRLNDGSLLEETVEYPIGHRRRRADGIPLLEAKFRKNLARRFPAAQQARILAASQDQSALEAMAVHEYVDLYVI